MELQEFLDEREKINNSNFKVTDDSSANWALRKIKQHQEQIKENNALAQAEIDKIEAWNQQENDKAQQSIDYFQGLLAKYAMDKREQDPKFKSLKLPNGNIGFRKKPKKWNYQDDVLLETLKQNQLTDFIRVKEQPDKSQIKKAFEVVGDKVINPETGEVLEGITVEDQEEDFSVKVSD